MIDLVMFLIKNDVKFLYECGFLKGDINFPYKEFNINLLELNEDFIEHIKNEDESILQKFLNK